MNTPDENLADDNQSSPPCLTIKTGRADCYAHFYPSLYQLTLETNGVEEKIDLGFSGSRLLERLAQIPGDVVAREELMSHAWSGRIVGQGSLNQQIYTLRQVLGDERERAIIQTLPRRGYLLNPQHLVTPVSPPANEQPSINPALPSSPTAAESTTEPQSGGYSNSGLVVLSLIALMGVLFFGYFAHGKGPRSLYGDVTHRGKLTISYWNQQHPEQVELLRSQTQLLTTRLEQLVDQPARLFVSLRGEFYELLCMQANGRARSVVIHHSQLDHVADEQLQWCFP